MSAAALLFLLAIAGPAAAADVYRCQGQDGKTEFRDLPCPGVGGKIAVQPNTIGEIDQSQLRAKREAIERRIQARADIDDAERARQLAVFRRQSAACQGYVDEARRQRAWYSAISPAVRQAAAAEVQIQARKYDEGNCDRYMP